MRPGIIILLLVFAAACGTWMLTLDPHLHFTTDVTDLLPPDERDPEASMALTLAKERQARVLLVMLTGPADGSPSELEDAATTFAASLRASPAFASAQSLASDTWRHDLGHLLYEDRFELLLPGWLAERRREYARLQASSGGAPPPFPEWLAHATLTALDARLSSPEGAAEEGLLASDPLLLIPTLASQASSLAPSVEIPAGRALVWTETRSSPLSEEGQQPVFAAISRATDAARARMPGLRVEYTGIHRIAAAAKESTRDEITRLNLVAIGAVLLITALSIRRVWSLLHLLPIILLSTLGAATATTLLFPRVHVLVFVLGALLCGVAVDYTFHIVLARREGEPYRARIRRIALPLMGGAGTTFGGFLALASSPLPLVRQLGVYVAAGVVAGISITILYLSLFPDIDVGPRRWVFGLRLPRRWRAPLIVVFLVVAAAGILRLHWFDDLRTLEYPAPSLIAEDTRIRNAFGDTDGGTNFITSGTTIAEARDRWQSLADAAPADAPLSGSVLFVPLPVDYAATRTPQAREDLTRFATALGEEMDQEGFERSAFAPFFKDFATYLDQPQPGYEAMAHDFLGRIPGPPGLLAQADAAKACFLSHAPHAFPVPPSAEGTVSLSGIENLNHLFARYRVATGELSMAGIAVVVLIACILHGPRRGLRTAALPLLSTALAFGVLALRGEPFGLFNLLGALLGVCLADDYAHFAHAAGEGEDCSSVRLSSLTTAGSFCALALSAIPAVSALGATVTLIVLFALLLVETDLLSLRHHA